MTEDRDRLLRRLNISFLEPDLLERALTHRSASRKTSYERLEFLGDACLSLIVSDYLYQRFQEASEGELTRMRALLVKGDTLAQIGHELELGNYLVLGPGEMKSGGHRRDSIVADAVEALLGALFLDGGMEAARQFVFSHWGSRLEAISPSVSEKDPKTRLQELLQAMQSPLPGYTVTDVAGQAPNQVFSVTCELEDGATFNASGSSRRRAEQRAAKQALEWLEQQS